MYLCQISCQKHFPIRIYTRGSTMCRPLPPGEAWSEKKYPGADRVKPEINGETLEKHCSWICNKAFLIHLSWFFIYFANYKSISMYKNFTDQKFLNFYRVCYNFWTIYGDFHFFWIITSHWTFWKMSDT